MEHKPDTHTCPQRGLLCVATAAQIVSAKWTPQLLYALSNGVHRFGRLQQEVGGVNPRTLSARLDELVQSGIINRQTVDTDSPYVSYALTDKGRDLIPILQQMIEWGDKYTSSEESPSLQSPVLEEA